MKKFNGFLLILTASLLITNSANSASFNCEKASSEYEKTVCSDSNLSTLDEQLAQTYKEARSKSSEQEQLKKTQIDWIKSARQCESNVECINKAYKERIVTLSSGDSQQSNITESKQAPKSSTISRTDWVINRWSVKEIGYCSGIWFNYSSYSDEAAKYFAALSDARHELINRGQASALRIEMKVAEAHYQKSPQAAKQFLTDCNNSFSPVLGGRTY